MSEHKHTQGPWEVGLLDDNGQRMVRGEHIEICTCWHHCVGSIEKEMEANARLIAAAPELLEALEYLFSEAESGSLDVNHDQMTAIREAIAKATGDA